MKGETFAGEPLDPYALKDEVRRIRAENEKLREALNWFLNGAVPLGGLTRYEYEFVVEARKRAAALKETGDE